MRKTIRDVCDISIVQQTSCEHLLPSVQMQLKMYFFIPFVRPCMHHSYGVISESHAFRDGVLPIILDAELYTTCPGERVLVVIIFNVTFPHSMHYEEKTCSCFSKDAENLTTHGSVLWCSRIVFIRPYSLNTTTAFYFVTECSDIAVLVRLWVCHVTTHSYFTWARPV